MIRDVGYTEADMGISADHCAVLVALHEQSARHRDGRRTTMRPKGKDIGAGDQGLMFGYACNDTPELMPLPIALAHTHPQSPDRSPPKRRSRIGCGPIARARSRSNTTAHTPVRIDTVVVSTQHSPDVTNAEIRKFIIEKIIKPVLPEELAGDDITYHINPTGRFVVGGPHGDCGLTGRKIIVDTYGGWGRHGGGAFSGKDPTKVDRSAAYMARYVAKNIVAAGLADRCEVQLAYAIGVSEPVSVNVDTEGTGRIDDARICELVREIFPLTPSGIIKHLDLRRPIYRKTAAGGHFGRNEPEFTWEKTDKAKQLAKAAESTAAAAR